jgi:hypothetical protein
VVGFDVADTRHADDDATESGAALKIKRGAVGSGGRRGPGAIKVASHRCYWHSLLNSESNFGAYRS